MTTTTSSTTTPSICQNLPGYDVTCNYFANATSCSSKHTFLDGIPFSTACQLACNLCTSGQVTLPTTTALAQCVDSQSACLFWAPYCATLLNNFNPHPCRKTCGKCGI